MVRISKQQERRSKSPKRHRICLAKKTGAQKDALAKGYKEHLNALEGPLAQLAFIPKIK